MLVIAQAVYIAAAAAHEANRAYCLQSGDTSQPLWDEAPAWQQRTVMKGVWHIAENPDTYPEKSHENWLREKEADGWIYGPVKDAEKKQHPNMVPYADLPDEQRIKDAIFIETVKGVLRALGHLD